MKLNASVLQNESCLLPFLKKMLKVHLLNSTKTNKAVRSKNNISDPMFDVIFILIMTRTCKK